MKFRFCGKNLRQTLSFEAKRTAIDQNSITNVMIDKLPMRPEGKLDRCCKRSRFKDENHSFTKENLSFFISAISRDDVKAERQTQRQKILYRVVFIALSTRICRHKASRAQKNEIKTDICSGGSENASCFKLLSSINERPRANDF